MSRIQNRKCHGHHSLLSLKDFMFEYITLPTSAAFHFMQLSQYLYEKAIDMYGDDMNVPRGLTCQKQVTQDLQAIFALAQNKWLEDVNDQVGTKHKVFLHLCS